MKRTSLSVTISRTIQLKQFHPVTVAITETAELDGEDNAQEAKLELYKSATATVTKFLNNEIRKHGDE